jgi:hypothetical protein
MVILTGNKFINGSRNYDDKNDAVGIDRFTVFAQALYCAATGNVIMNRTDGGYSLWVEVYDAGTTNIALPAVTGNVLMGQMVVPQRGGTPPLPDWDTYNMMVPQI